MRLMIKEYYGGKQTDQQSIDTNQVSVKAISDAVTMSIQRGCKVSIEQDKRWL